MTVGQLLFLVVTHDWLLILPAVVCGFGHALLFPAIVSIGAGRFPVQYRGSGTTLVLGFTEMGTALAAPLLGWLIDKGNAGGGTRGFSWMFIAASAFACVGLAYYALTAARRPDHDPHLPAKPGTPPQMIESDVGDMIAVPAVEPAPARDVPP